MHFVSFNFAFMRFAISHPVLSNGLSSSPECTSLSRSRTSRDARDLKTGFIPRRKIRSRPTMGFPIAAVLSYRRSYRGSHTPADYSAIGERDDASLHLRYCGYFTGSSLSPSASAREGRKVRETIVVGADSGARCRLFPFK